MAPACDYRRPPLPVQEFRDERGEVIDYGNRWGMDGPPEYTYSVVTHPERFDPLDPTGPWPEPTAPASAGRRCAPAPRAH